jgi:acyl carrier protein
VRAAEIAVLISELLEGGDVALDDDFFDIGGNSLLALDLLARLEERTGLKITLLDIFRAASPDELAVLVADRSREGNGAEAAAGPR